MAVSSRGSRRADEFTPMQAAFIDSYMLCRSARRAADEAGYCGDPNAGWRLLQNKKIVDEINRRKEEQRRRNELLEDEVLREIAKVAFTDICDVVDFTGSTLEVKDLSEIPENARSCIKRVTLQPSQYGDRITVEMYDKLKAQELLGKYLDMWSERLKVEGGEKPLQHEHSVCPTLLKDRILALQGAVRKEEDPEDFSDL